MSTPPSPAYIQQVLLAREAPMGLIVLYGHRKRVHLIKWNTDSDTFEEGAWMRGTIYPQYSDLSPDGSMFIYSACNHANPRDEFPPYWTAVSKVPWLTALAAWDNGYNDACGGFFQTNTKVLLNIYEAWLTPIRGEVPEKFEIVPVHKLWKAQDCYQEEMEINGWRAIPGEEVPRALSYEKDSPDGDWTLLRNFSREMVFFNYEIMRDREKLGSLPHDATWADFDQSGRFVYSSMGKLCTASMDSSGQLVPRELADFSALSFHRTKSPDWARTW